MIGIVLAFSCGLVQAQNVPPLVNYQGKLTKADGTALDPGGYKLVFNIYDKSMPTPGEKKVWGPLTINNVPVVGGFFNVLLGDDDSGNSIQTAFSGSGRYLGITVGNSSQEISPRQQILSTPYAFQAGQAEKATEAVHAVDSDTVRGKDVVPEIDTLKQQASNFNTQISGLTSSIATIEGRPKSLGAMIVENGVVVAATSGMTLTCPDFKYCFLLGNDFCTITFPNPEGLKVLIPSDIKISSTQLKLRLNYIDPENPYLGCFIPTFNFEVRGFK